MNIKRIFGSLLTVLGIIGLIVAAVLFVSARGGTNDFKTLATYGILGLIFFISGIGLIRTTKDVS
jgi:predicted Na+-dependent transporter